MHYKEFIKKYKKRDSGKIYELNRIGIKLMKETKDPLHDYRHVYNMLSNLDIFLRKNKKILNVIEIDVLSTAIIWHDVWKASKKPYNGIFYIYEELNDGLGSAKIFKKYADKLNLNKFFVEKVAYAIKKHAIVQFFQTKTKEAKLLQDLDHLENANFQRLYKSRRHRFIYRNKLAIKIWTVILDKYFGRRIYFKYFDSKYNEILNEFRKLSKSV